MKKIVALLMAILVVAALFAACAQPTPTPEKPAEPVAPAASADQPAEPAAEKPAEPVAPAAEPYIAVISKGFQHQFWQAVKQGAEQAGKDLGCKVTFEGPENESQVDKQIEMFDAALANNPVAVCFAALDAKAAEAQLQTCKAKNIPVVGFDSGVDSDIPVATAATDNMNAAGAAADKMAEALGGKGKVALIVHDQTSLTGIQRRDGFKARIEEKYPDIQIVDIQYGGGDHAKSADIAKAMLQADSEIAGIFGANEGSAVGALLGVKEAGKLGKVVIIGYDAGKAQKDAVRSGDMYGAISQDPVQIGYKAVEAAYKAYKGEAVEKNIDTGYAWYDKTNVDDAKLAMLLYD